MCVKYDLEVKVRIKCKVTRKYKILQPLYSSFVPSTQFFSGLRVGRYFQTPCVEIQYWFPHNLDAS